MVRDHFERPNSYIHQHIKHKARTLCRNCAFHRSEFPDIVQALWLHLLEQEQQFDPSRASFETFANQLITNKVRSMLRHRQAAKRDPGREEASLNETVDPGKPNSARLSDTIAESREARPADRDQMLDIQMLLDRLPEEDREPAARYIDGMNKRELREAFGLSRKDVDDMLRRIAMNARLLRMDD